MPDHPLPRVPGLVTAILFPWIPVLEFFVKIGGGPAMQSVLDHRSRSLQASRQFGGTALRLPGPVPVPHRRQIGTALTHQEMEPPDPHRDDMPSKLAYGEDIRGRAEHKLFGSQRGNRCDEALLIDLPALEESGERKRTGHGAALLHPTAVMALVKCG